MIERDVLLDVSRLVWRLWTGRLPTGIDRVCLAYLEHYAARSQAVLQRKGRRRVLTAEHSDRLFGLLLDRRASFRREISLLLPPALARGRGRIVGGGRIYLNVGHTGLDDPALPGWIADSGLRAVHMIHDLIPISHPEYCRPGEAQRHRARMTHALRSAAGILGNSQATIDETDAFARSAGLPMPPALAAWICGAEMPARTRAAAAGNHPYFVVLGTIEGRKNHLLLLQVWRELIRQDGATAPRLIIIGQRGWEAEGALGMLDRSPMLGSHVEERGRCGDAELAELMAGARAMLMPSFAEGFGLPVIEALATGTPVIASDLPVFREIGAGIPDFVDPLDGPGWIDRIRRFSTDGPERARQIASMPGYRAPNWPDHFDAVDRWIARL